VTGTPDPTNSSHKGYTPNGTLQLSTQNSSWGGTGTPSITAGGATFYLDDFCFWNRSMDSDDVAELYNSGQLVNPTSLSFFSTANLGVWLKCGDHADDAIVTDAEDELYSTGVNSIIDNSGNGNHFLPIATNATSIGKITIDSSNYPPNDGA